MRLVGSLASLSLSNGAPPRTRATRCGAVTARHRFRPAVYLPGGVLGRSPEDLPAGGRTQARDCRLKSTSVGTTPGNCCVLVTEVVGVELLCASWTATKSDR